jgi:nucleotide-binding universal stress UspA family protein
MVRATTNLCPVDFSDTSREALRWAAALATIEPARLSVLTVVPPLLAQAARAAYHVDLARDEVGPELEAFVASALPAWSGVQTRHVMVGEPAECILEAAAGVGGSGLPADLIVMGASGVGGVEKVILGSTAERVLRRTRTPVLTVPKSSSGAVVLEGGKVSVKPSRVLAAVDFTERTQPAAHVAARYARLLGVPLLLLHVVAPQGLGERWRAMAEREAEERTREAEAALTRLAADIAAPEGTRVSVLSGSPAEQIVAMSADAPHTLVVMGLLGDRGVMGPRPGSIAYKVLSHAHTPVLVVPPEAAPGAA